MSAGLFVLAAVLVGILIGHLACRKYGSMSDTVYAVWRSVFAVSWIVSGVALIIGGYVVFGALLIALFWFVLAGGLSDLKEETGVDGVSFRRFLSR